MSKSSDRGFSLLEIFIVLGVAMIVGVIALPSITGTIANAKMRASMTSLSGLFQNCRMAAVQQNKTKWVRVQTNSQGLIAFIKDAGDTGSITVSDYQIAMEAPITQHTTPTGGPSALTSTELGFSSPQTGNPSFNSRGLPCLYASGVCTTNYGFVSYYKDNRIAGSGGWAALSISPAGRIKRWFWSGSAWVS
jgi:Tfp pilus assembly protein FimT